MHPLNQTLHELGMNEKESAVYLALLSISPATVQDLADKAGVNRSTTYLYLESLEKRKIVHTTIKDKKTLFVADPPEKLLSILRVEQTKLEDQAHRLHEMIPFFNALYNGKASKPTIHYFEGMEGIKEMRARCLVLEGDYVQIIPIDEVNAVDEIVKAREAHKKEIVGHQAKGKRIIVVTPSSDLSGLTIDDSLTRSIPFQDFPIKAEITVRGHVVVFISFRPSILVVMIESREFAESYRAIFSLAWKSVPPPVFT